MTPSPKLTLDICRILDGANYGHLATLMPGGEPKVDPVWVARDGDKVLVTSDRKSIKTQNVERDARVALSVVAFENPYEQALIRGIVTELRPDDELAALDAMALKYLGAPFPRRRWSNRVVLMITPTLARYYRSPLVDPRLG